MNNEKLLPCPFCGGEGKATAEVWHNGQVTGDGYVRCKECDAVISACDHIKAWNTRSSPPANDTDVVSVMGVAIIDYRDSVGSDAAGAAKATLIALQSAGYRITKGE